MSTDTQSAAPIELYQAIASDRVVRWGYDQTLDHEGLARFIREQAEGPNLRADADTAWRFAANRNVDATTAGKEPATPSAADRARQLLDEATAPRVGVQQSLTVDQLIAAANAYIALAELPDEHLQTRLNQMANEFDVIDTMLTAAGVPDLIDEPLSARVAWLIEQWRGDNTDQTNNPP